jgi:hypothetical protein
MTIIIDKKSSSYINNSLYKDFYFVSILVVFFGYETKLMTSN